MKDKLRSWVSVVTALVVCLLLLLWAVVLAAGMVASKASRTEGLFAKAALNRALASYGAPSRFIRIWRSGRQVVIYMRAEDDPSQPGDLGLANRLALKYGYMFQGGVMGGEVGEKEWNEVGTLTVFYVCKGFLGYRVERVAHFGAWSLPDCLRGFPLRDGDVWQHLEGCADLYEEYNPERPWNGRTDVDWVRHIILSANTLVPGFRNSLFPTTLPIQLFWKG